MPKLLPKKSHVINFSEAEQWRQDFLGHFRGRITVESKSGRYGISPTTADDPLADLARFALADTARCRSCDEMAEMTISPRLTDRRGDDESLPGPTTCHLPPVGAWYAPGGPDPAAGGGHG
jgi:hypothetical protein